MKLQLVYVDYVDVGILWLPKGVYQDENGNLWRYDVSWEKEEKEMSENKKLESLLHKKFPKIIEGEKVFENPWYKWLGIRDGEGNVYRLELVRPSNAKM
jgi:hypothetical protein